MLRESNTQVMFREYNTRITVCSSREQSKLPEAVESDFDD